MKKLFSLALILFLGAQLYAQGGKITTAALDFQDGNFASAITNAKQGLTDPSLKEKQALKGNSILLRSYCRLFQDAAKAEDKKAAFMAKYPNFVSECWTAYETISKSSDGEYKDQIKDFLPVVAYALYMESLELQQKKKLNEAMVAIDRSEKCFATAGQNNYYTHYSRAFLLIDKETKADSAAAIVEFEKTIELYKKPKEETGGGVAGAYAMLIRLYGRWKKDLKKALDISAKAQAAYPNNEDIRSAELDVYLVPEMFNEAITKFKTELDKNPNDAMTLKIYSSLLEKKLRNEEEKKAPEAELEKLNEEVIGLYKKVLSTGTDNEFANFNLGAMYFNKAVKLHLKMDALPMNKQDEYAKIEGQKKEALKAALPYMEATHKIAPKNIECMQILVKICTELGMEDEPKAYKSKLEALGVTTE